jgi:competence protein ComGC
MIELSNSKAMSMVEIMIGVLLLALIIIPSLNVISTKTRAVTSTRDHSQAAFVGQKIQEMARAFKFDMLEADRYDSEPDKQKRTFEWQLKNKDEFNTQIVNGIAYKVEDVDISPVANKNDSDSINHPLLQLLKFTIKYDGKDGKQHLLNFNTAIFKKD